MVHLLQGLSIIIFICFIFSFKLQKAVFELLKNPPSCGSIARPLSMIQIFVVPSSPPLVLVLDKTLLPVTQTGSHSQLLLEDGLYARLTRRQADAVA